MATNKLERVYTIPLRSDFIKVPKYYRAKRAINNIKKYIEKHMKTEDVRIGNVLNEHVWAHGIKNPPGKVTVKAINEGDYVTVELEGHTYKTVKVQTEKTEKPTSFKDKLAAKLKTDKSEEKSEELAEKVDKKAVNEAYEEEKAKEIKKADSKTSDEKPKADVSKK